MKRRVWSIQAEGFLALRQQEVFAALIHRIYWLFAARFEQGAYQKRVKQSAVVNSPVPTYLSKHLPSIARAYKMPSTLLSLPDEVLRMICNLFALDLEETPARLAFAWIPLKVEEKENRRTLLSLCLTSKRLKIAARPPLHYAVQPVARPGFQGLDRSYRNSLFSADLKDCLSLVMPVGTGNEFSLLHGLRTLKTLHLVFDASTSVASASMILHELSTRPSITQVSFHLVSLRNRKYYLHSILRMLTHLETIRDLHIHGYPHDFVQDHRYDPVSSVPLRLDRLRIHSYWDRMELQRMANEYLPCFDLGHEGKSGYLCGTVMWTRRTAAGSGADVANGRPNTDTEASADL